MKDRMKVAVTHYLPIGDLEDIVVAAGPDDLEIVKSNQIQLYASATSED